MEPWRCFSHYNVRMKHYTLPIIIERDAEGFYVAEHHARRRNRAGRVGKSAVIFGEGP